MPTVAVDSVDSLQEGCPVGFPEVDFSSWPIILVAPPVVMPNDHYMADLAEYFRSEAETRGGAYATVLDLSQNQTITPRQRKYMAGRLELQAKSGSNNVCTALIFSSGLLRGLLTAIFWLRSPPFPVEVFPDREAAFTWARVQLQNAA